jgi:hypothetical protein
MAQPGAADCDEVHALALVLLSFFSLCVTYRVISLTLSLSPYRCICYPSLFSVSSLSVYYFCVSVWLAGCLCVCGSVCVCASLSLKHTHIVS